MSTSLTSRLPVCIVFLPNKTNLFSWRSARVNSTILQSQGKRPGRLALSTNLLFQNIHSYNAQALEIQVASCSIVHTLHSWIDLKLKWALNDGPSWLVLICRLLRTSRWCSGLLVLCFERSSSEAAQLYHQRARKKKCSQCENTSEDVKMFHSYPRL